jgi:7-keto-8-aminopelargonate synthetase-like enzyme
VTESLFSMDADIRDLAALQDVCCEFHATLLVDVAHDLGCIGEDGRGHLGQPHRLGLVDVVMGDHFGRQARPQGHTMLSGANLPVPAIWVQK